VTDFANLVLAVDATSVNQGADALDRLAASGARASQAGPAVVNTTRATGQAAAAMARDAQMASVATVSATAGLAGLGGAGKLASHHLTNLTFQLNDVVSGLAMGQAPMQILTQQGGQFYQIIQQSGVGARGFAVALAEMTGIIKTTTNAELALEAANAARAAGAVRGAAQQAAAAVMAADTELALAEAQLRTASGATAEAAAQARLAAAHRGVAVAAGQATTAEYALAEATARAGAASEASRLKTVTSIGRMGIALLSIGTIATVAYAGFKTFSDEVSKSGVLDRYAEGLRLTDAQIRAAGGSVKYLADGTREVTGLSVSFGSVARAAFQVVGEHAGITGATISSAIGSAFKFIGNFGMFTIQTLLAGFAALVQMMMQVGRNMKALATGDFDNMKDVLGVGKAQFDKTFADIGKGFDDIGKRAIELEQKGLLDTSNSNKPPKPKAAAKAKGDGGLADELARLEAQIRGQLRLAEAYQVSDAASIKAEALQKAEEAAIKRKGDTAIFYEKHLRLAIAQRLADGAKMIADIHAESAARAVVNDLVEQGIIPVQRMSQALEEQQKKRQLMAALAVAEDEGRLDLVQKLRAAIDNLAFSQGVLNEDLAKTAVLTAQGSKADELKQLELEATLIGASNQQRAIRLAQLEAENYIRDNNITNPDDRQNVLNWYVDSAVAANNLTEAQNNYNLQLTHTLTLLDLMVERTQMVGELFGAAFGRAGEAVGDMLTTMVSLQAQQQEIADWKRDESKKAGTDAVALANIEAQAQAKSKNAQIHAVSSLLGATKGLFKEHSAGYKAMEAAEKAFAIVQMVSTIKAVAAGAAKMFSQLGVWAFPAVAAMVAVMAGLGFAGGGGGSATPPTSAQDLQDRAGTGTILGDSAAKSASIEHSLDLMAKNSTKGLDHSWAMVTALRKIESGIGDLAAALARTLGLKGGFFDPEGMGLGTSSKGIQGLFGSTTTKSLYDQGITLNPATVGAIIESGITGATYNVVEKIKKNSGFLGIGGSTKTSYSTTTGTLDPALTGQVQMIIGSIYDTIVDAASVFGLDVAGVLKNFTVQIGQLSFKDMTGEQITEQLEAIFSAVADQMAGFAVDGLEEFQKAGEGLYETLMRLAKDYLVIDAALSSIGMTFGAVGASSIAARESLLELSGGLDAFVDQVNYFYDNFLSDAQKLAFMESQVNAAFAALNVTVPASVEDFAALVTSLDLSSTAGQELFAAMMKIAPAFYEVATAAEELAVKQQELQIQILQASGRTEEALALQRQMQLAAANPALHSLMTELWAVQDAARAAADALALQNKTQQLQIRLLQAQGKTEEALALQRQMELAAIDPSLQGLLKQIFAAEDAAKRAAAAAQKQADAERVVKDAKDALLSAYERESGVLRDTADKFRGFAADLREFRDNLFLTDGNGGGVQRSLVRLMEQAGLARGGDEKALGGGLQDAATRYLEQAKASASTLQDVQRARALVARYVDQAIGGAEGKATIAEQQLKKMTDQVSKLVDIDKGVLSVADAIKNLTALMFPAAAPAPAVPRPGRLPRNLSEVPAEFLSDPRVIALLEKQTTAIEQATVSSNKTARVLERVTKDGNSLIVSTDADTPLNTTGLDGGGA
jgi:hypothetical protein